MTFLSSIKSGIGKVLDLSVVPGVSVTKLAIEIQQHPVKSALTAATGFIPLAGGAKLISAGSKVAKVAATAFNSLSFSTKAAAVIASPVVVGVLKESKKARESLVKLPSSLLNFGSNIGKTIDDPSLNNLKTIAIENPALTAGAAAAGVAGAGIGLSGLYNLLLQRKNNSLLNENNNLMKNPVDNINDRTPLPTDNKKSIQVEKDIAELTAKNAIDQIEASTKSQIAVLEAQTKQAKELIALQSMPVPSQGLVGVPVSQTSTLTSTTLTKKKAPKKKKKKKKAPKRKKKKKNTKKYKKSAKKKKKRKRKK
jgi:hypothetical protein